MHRIIFFRPVVPGTKRNKVDFHTVEQEAGRAVLKLLDAKIGKYVVRRLNHLFTHVPVLHFSETKSK